MKKRVVVSIVVSIVVLIFTVGLFFVFNGEVEGISGSACSRKLGNETGCSGGYVCFQRLSGEDSYGDSRCHKECSLNEDCLQGELCLERGLDPEDYGDTVGMCFDIECTPAGGSADEYSFGRWMGVVKTCCEGLATIPVRDYEDGECLFVFDAGTICSDCGNGVCEDWENQCNCAEDC